MDHQISYAIKEPDHTYAVIRRAIDLGYLEKMRVGYDPSILWKTLQAVLMRCNVCDGNATEQPGEMSFR
jgi:hypothetical protein